MITHVVTFRWKPGTTAEQIEAVATALATLPDLVPSIDTYAFGTDLGLGGAGNMDFGIVATFDSVEAWTAYNDDPEHSRVRSEIILPCVADRAAVQFRT